MFHNEVAVFGSWLNDILALLFRVSGYNSMRFLACCPEPCLPQVGRSIPWTVGFTIAVQGPEVPLFVHLDVLNASVSVLR